MLVPRDEVASRLSTVEGLELEESHVVGEEEACRVVVGHTVCGQVERHGERRPDGACSRAASREVARVVHEAGERVLFSRENKPFLVVVDLAYKNKNVQNYEVRGLKNKV